MLILIGLLRFVLGVVVASTLTSFTLVLLTTLYEKRYKKVMNEFVAFAILLGLFAIYSQVVIKLTVKLGLS